MHRRRVGLYRRAGLHRRVCLHRRVDLDSTGASWRVDLDRLDRKLMEQA